MITESVGFQILLLQIAKIFVMHSCGFFQLVWSV